MKTVQKPTNVKIVQGEVEKHLEFVKQLASTLVPYATWYESNFLQLFNKASHATFVLEHQSQPVAFCSFILQDGIADIELTATAKAFQKKGFGTMLFKHCINFLSQQNFNAIVLEVAQNNFVAQKFYQKLGFVKQHRVIKNYYNDGQDALVFLLKLQGDQGGLPQS